jgi:hypothetical protein
MMIVLGIIIFVYTEEVGCSSCCIPHQGNSSITSIQTVKNLQPRANLRRRLKTCILGLGRQLDISKEQKYRSASEENLETGRDAAELMEVNGLLSDYDRNPEQSRLVEPQSSSVSSKGIWTFSFLMTLCSQAFFDLHMG